MAIPVDVSVCTFTGTIESIQIVDDVTTTVPASGVVVFTPSVPRLKHLASDTVFIPRVLRVPLDNTGSFTIDVVATDDADLDIQDWTYGISFELDGNLHYDPLATNAPSDATVDLSDITPTAASGGTLTASQYTELSARVSALESGGGGGVTDHGALTGLGDDDHTQYALADGSRGNFDSAGAASSAVSSHEAAGDPHTQYSQDGHTHTESDITGYTPGAYLGINAQTGTTYQPVLSDDNKLVTCDNASPVTVTLPNNTTAAFAVGHRIDWAVLGSGVITFVAEGGCSAYGTPSLVLRAQYSTASTVKIATNAWLVVGDLA